MPSDRTTRRRPLSPPANNNPRSVPREIDILHAIVEKPAPLFRLKHFAKMTMFAKSMYLWTITAHTINRRDISQNRGLERTMGSRYLDKSNFKQSKRNKW